METAGGRPDSPPGEAPWRQEAARAVAWGRASAYGTVAAVLMAQPFAALVLRPARAWIPLDENVLDPLVAAVALTLLASAAAVGIRRCRRLARRDPDARRASRKGLAWAVPVLVVDGIAALLFWLAALVNGLVA